MGNDEKMINLWRAFSDATGRCNDNFAGIAADKNAVSLARNEIVGLLRDLRDTRREFMNAAGECDDAWLDAAEAKELSYAAWLSALIVSTFRITDEEIESAPVFKTSTGRMTAMPQFPRRFDA
jgi:hypothetical protein